MKTACCIIYTTYQVLNYKLLWCRLGSETEQWTAEVELKVKEAAGLLGATLETVVASTVAMLQLPSVHCTVSCMQLAVPVVWVPCWGRVVDLLPFLHIHTTQHALRVGSLRKLKFHVHLWIKEKNIHYLWIIKEKTLITRIYIHATV